MSILPISSLQAAYLGIICIAAEPPASIIERPDLTILKAASLLCLLAAPLLFQYQTWMNIALLLPFSPLFHREIANFWFLPALSLIALLSAENVRHKTLDLLKRNSAGFLLLLFISALTISIILSPVPQTAFEQSLKFFCLILFFINIAVKPNSKKYNLFITSCVLFALFSMGTFAKLLRQIEILGFINGINLRLWFAGMHYNVVAMQMLLFFPGLIYLAGKKNKFYLRMTAIPALFFASFTILGTFSKAAILLFFSQLITLSFILFRKGKKEASRHYAGPAVVTMILIIASAAVFVSPQLRHAVEERIFQSSSYYPRLYIWKIAGRMALDYPFFGTGLFAFQNQKSYAPPYDCSVCLDVKTLLSSHLQTHAHNIYLEMLRSIGIVGCSLLILVVIAFFKKEKHSKTAFIRLKFYCAAGLISLAIYGLIDHPLTDMSLAAQIFLFSALMVPELSSRMTTYRNPFLRKINTWSAGLFCRLLLPLLCFLFIVTGVAQALQSFHDEIIRKNAGRLSHTQIERLIKLNRVLSGFKPLSSDPLMNLAQNFERIHRFKIAAYYWKKASELNLADPFIPLRQGMNSMARSRFAEAETYFNEAFYRDPRSIECRNSLLFSAYALTAQEKTHEAFSTLKKSLYENPSQIVNALWLETYDSIHRNNALLFPSEPVSIAEMFVTFCGENKEQFENKYARTKKLFKVPPEFEASFLLNRNALMCDIKNEMLSLDKVDEKLSCKMLNAGRVFAFTGRIEESRSLFELYFKFFPYSAEGRRELVELDLMEGNYESIERMAEENRLYHYLVDHYLDLNEYDKALSAFEKSLGANLNLSGRFYEEFLEADDEIYLDKLWQLLKIDRYLYPDVKNYAATAKVELLKSNVNKSKHFYSKAVSYLKFKMDRQLGQLDDFEDFSLVGELMRDIYEELPEGREKLFNELDRLSLEHETLIRAFFLQNSDDPVKAMQMLLNVNEEGNAGPSVALLTVLQLLQNERLETAEKYLESLLERYYSPSLAAKLSFVKVRLNKIDEAFQLFKTTLHVPDGMKHPSPLLWFAFLKEAANEGDRSAARRILNRLSDQTIKDERLLKQIIDISDQLEAWDISEELITKAESSLQNSETVILAEARNYLRKGRFDLAADKYKQLLDFNEFFTESYIQLALIEKANGNIPQALSYLEEAEAKLGENADVFYCRALIYESVKDYDAAIANYRRALKKNPRRLDIRDAYDQLSEALD